MFRYPFSFKGRIGRIEYLLSHVIYTGSNLLSGYLIPFIQNEWLGFLVSVFLFIPVFWFLIAQTAKRCHDRGMSGWAQLVVPYQFILFFADSQQSENEYGPGQINKPNW